MNDPTETPSPRSDAAAPLRLLVPDAARGQRLDAFLAQALAQTPNGQGLSRARIKALVKAGAASVNGRICPEPDLRLAGGETLAIDTRVLPTGGGLTPETGSLSVLYRDDDLLVLNKPPGLTVHPAPGRPEGTLAHRLAHHFPELAAMGGVRPGIVHRLDQDTSGLLLVALHEEARLRLSRAFAAREVRKRYLAVARGVPDRESGRIDLPIGRHPTRKTLMAVAAKGGKPALTDYRALYADPAKRFSLLDVAIHTGRTHQIRVHLSHIGLPLYGDKTYGGVSPTDDPLLCRLARRQMLHAWTLALRHPMNGQDMSFVLPPPKDFLRVLLYLSRTLQRVVITGLPGCGKSSVLDLLTQAGQATWSADKVVASLYAAGGDGRLFLERRFGRRFLREANKGHCGVDKQALFAAMRESQALRREIEEAVHPMVAHELDGFWRTQAGRRVAFAEVPLFLEAGWKGPGVDVLVGVHCPRPERLKRLSVGRGWSEETFAAMESWQWPEKKKMQACGLILNNADRAGESGGLERLAAKTAGLARVLARLRRDRAARLLARFTALASQPSSAEAAP